MCGCVVCSSCSPSRRAVEGFSGPERVCNNCTNVGDQIAAKMGNVLLITDSIAEMKGHEYLRQLKFAAHVKASQGGFQTILSYAPETAHIDEMKMQNLRAFGISELRTLEDYVWLREQIKFRLKPRHKIVPPLFPLKNKKSKAEQLSTFLNVLIKHILLHDDPIIELFLTISKQNLEHLKLFPGTLKDITAWSRCNVVKREVHVMRMFKNDGESWYRFKIEQRCCELISAQQDSREARQKQRLQQHTDRLRDHAKRAEGSHNRMDGMEKRNKTHNDRVKERQERTNREIERKDNQRATDRLVFIWRVDDDKKREETAEIVKTEREDFDISSKAYSDAVVGHKRHQDALVSVKTELALDKQEFPNKVHKWLLQNMQAEFPKLPPGTAPELVRKVKALRDEIPERSLVENERLNELKSKYNMESDLVLEEKDLLEKEKLGMKKEEKNWEQEYVQIETETQLRAEERAIRKKKEESIEADVKKQETVIEERAKDQGSRLELQTQRKDEQNSRQNKHENQREEQKRRMAEQIAWEAKLNEAIGYEKERLKRQRTEAHVLKFDHSQSETLLTNIRQGLETHKKAMDEFKAILRIHIDSNKVDLRNNETEKTQREADRERMLEGQGRRTVHELKDGKYDERDDFAIEIHKRRMRCETSLQNEQGRLLAEKTRLDKEKSRIVEEEKLISHMNTTTTSEEVQIVALVDLVASLATVVREDETTRASKMKEYLEFCNQLVARQTERILRYKEIKSVQKARTAACAQRLAESKASMTKLIDLDEASNTRLENTSTRSDRLERQRNEQAKTEERIFFDNVTSQEQREAETKAARKAGEEVRLISKFLSSLRPAMNLGMKEKSEQVRILQETWKSSKRDHNLLVGFTKKYSKGDISLSGMDSIPDHDNDFAHTLRGPYELGFKQDEMESKEFFHPISNELLKEGDTFSMLRSSQDDLTVWVQKVQDSLRDEDKARKLEEDHRQSQLRLRLQKEKKMMLTLSRLGGAVESVVGKCQEASKKIEAFRQSMIDSNDLKKQKDVLANNIAKTAALGQEMEKKTPNIQKMKSSATPDEKMVSRTEKELSKLRSLVSKISRTEVQHRASLEAAKKGDTDLDGFLKEFAKKAIARLEEIKGHMRDLQAEHKAHPKDEWLIHRQKGIGELKSRINNYLGKIKELVTEGKKCSQECTQWEDIIISLVTEQESACELFKKVVVTLEKLDDLMRDKQAKHNTWREENQNKVTILEQRTARSKAKLSRLNDKVKHIEDFTSTQLYDNYIKECDQLLNSMRDKKGLTVDLASTQSTLDNVRVIVVRLRSRATDEVKKGDHAIQTTKDALREVKEILVEKSVVNDMLEELHAIPKFHEWDPKVDTCRKKLEGVQEGLIGVSVANLDEAVKKLEASIETLSLKLPEVFSNYTQYKEDMEKAAKMFKGRQGSE
uniref:Uncharacterized protein n=1 Tax=Amorphochlora amoebiformis TaxID=1561963 RepID=A0A7S0CMX0_9EUKA